MLLAFALGCAPAELVFSPASLDFGEVDFAGEMPVDGYASASVTLTNESGPALTLWLPEYDADRLCLAGFDADRAFPVELGELAEGSSYNFVVGVCAYGEGELTADVSTELSLATDGNPASVALPITFTAIRSSE